MRSLKILQPAKIQHLPLANWFATGSVSILIEKLFLVYSVCSPTLTKSLIFVLFKA